MLWPWQKVKHNAARITRKHKNSFYSLKINYKIIKTNSILTGCFCYVIIIKVSLKITYGGNYEN